jgi:hypothetical protein
MTMEYKHNSSVSTTAESIKSQSIIIVLSFISESDMIHSALEPFDIERRAHTSLELSYRVLRPTVSFHF